MLSITAMRQRVLVRRFWRYVLPSILAMVIPASYYLVDGVFIGHFVGAEGLAAINLVYPVIMVLIGISAMISMGAATRIALHLGARNQGEARQVLVNTLWLLLAFGLLTPLLLHGCHEAILCALDLPPASLTWQHASDYLRWIGVGTLLLATNLAVPYLVRNDGRPKLAMALTLLGGVLNILFTALLVAWWRKGLVGVAQGLLLTELIVTLLGLGYFFTPYAKLRLRLTDLRPRWPEMPSQLFAGSPTLVANLNVGLILLLHNSQLLVYGSVADVAGYTVAGYTEAVFVVVLQGLAFGVQPLVSQAAGAGRNDELRFLMSRALRMTLLYGLVMWGVLHLFPDNIAQLFVGSGDEAVMTSAVNSLTLNLMAMPLEGLELMGIVLLQAMHRPRQALSLTVAKTLLLLPLITGLPQLWARNGVLLAQPMTVLLLAFPLFWLLWREWRFLAQPPDLEPEPLAICRTAA